MSDIEKDIHVDLVLPKLKMSCRKHIYQTLAREMAGYLRCPAILLFDRLMDKEKVSASGIGDGIAMPHLRVRGLEKPFTALMTLNSPVEFDTPDNRPVDLVCCLVSPERDGPLHLRRLSRLSRLFRNQQLKQKIIDSADADTIRSLLTAPDGWMLAA